MSKNKERCNAI